MTPKRGPRFKAVLAMFLWVIPAVGQAQTGNIPRGPDGKPDLSGVWQVLNSAAWDLQDHTGALNFPPGQSVVEGGTIPYLPAAAAKFAAGCESATLRLPSTTKSLNLRTACPLAKPYSVGELH